MLSNGAYIYMQVHTQVHGTVAAPITVNTVIFHNVFTGADPGGGLGARAPP